MQKIFIKFLLYQNNKIQYESVAIKIKVASQNIVRKYEKEIRINCRHKVSNLYWNCKNDRPLKMD